MSMTTNTNAGKIEETLTEAGQVIELPKSTTVREALAQALAHSILNSLDGDPRDEGCVMVKYSIRKAKGDKPQRIVAHCEHTRTSQKSVMFTIGPMPAGG